MSADASTKRLMRINGPTLILAALFAVLGSPASPQSAEEASALMPPLGWRSIGPDRGGRSIAVAGHSGRPFEYYFGATGGGLFKTTDGGESWDLSLFKSAKAGATALVLARTNPDVL